MGSMIQKRTQYSLGLLFSVITGICLATGLVIRLLPVYRELSPPQLFWVAGWALVALVAFSLSLVLRK